MFLRFFLSLEEIDCSGILVIFDIVISISSFVIFIGFLFILFIFLKAPVSSITSIALSGKNLSFIYFDDNSTADLIDSSEYETS